MKRFLLPAFAALLLLTGCDMGRQLSHSMFGTATEKEIIQMPDCPRPVTLTDASYMPVFADGGTDLSLEGKLGGITGTCAFEKGAAVMEIKVTFAARKSKPEVDINKMMLPYFIAIMSPGQEVLQRQGFSTKIGFDNNGYGASEEEHTLRIPVPSKEAAGGYNVVVGLELSPDQLAYNRKRKEHPDAH